MGSTGYGVSCMHDSLLGCRREGGGCKGADAFHSLLHLPLMTAECSEPATKHVQSIGLNIWRPSPENVDLCIGCTEGLGRAETGC